MRKQQCGLHGGGVQAWSQEDPWGPGSACLPTLKDFFQEDCQGSDNLGTGKNSASFGTCRGARHKEKSPFRKCFFYNPHPGTDSWETPISQKRNTSRERLGHLSGKTQPARLRTNPSPSDVVAGWLMLRLPQGLVEGRALCLCPWGAEGQGR